MQGDHVIRVGDKFYELKNPLRTVTVIEVDGSADVRVQTISNAPNKRVGHRGWIKLEAFRERFEPVAVR